MEQELLVGPRIELYVAGRRRVLPPLVFGAGVLWHLLRHGRRYDAVHTASFPYFSLLAAGVARGRGRFRILVHLFPLVVLHGGRFATVVAGFALFLLANGLLTPPPNVGARTTPLYNDATGRAVSGATSFATLDSYTRQTVFALSSATPSRISRHTGSPKVGMRMKQR